MQPMTCFTNSAFEGRPLAAHHVSAEDANLDLDLDQPRGVGRREVQCQTPPLAHPCLHRDTVETAPMKLKRGWNKVLIRSASYWDQTAIGLVLQAPENLLWSLRISASPPAQ